MMADLANLNSSRLRTDQQEWEVIGSLTSSHATLSTSERHWDDISQLDPSEFVYWEVPKDANAIELRFQTDNDGDSHEVEIYASRGKQNHYVRMVALTLTGGAQDADNSRKFVDTIAVSSSSEQWYVSGVVVDSGNNGICRYMIDLYGYGDLVFIAPSLQSGSTLVIEASRV